MPPSRLRWSLLAIALLVAAFAWFRALAFDRPTGPHRVTWYGPDDRPIVVERYGSGPGDSLMTAHPLVRGNRLIVRTHGSGGSPDGYGWIDPGLGRAKVAWPVDGELLGRSIPEGMAVHGDAFAVVFSVENDGAGALYVGLAGPEAWTRAPFRILAWEDGDESFPGRPILLATGWVDGAVELVLTHPGPDDPYGHRQPPDILRIPASGEPTTTSFFFLPCEGCSVVGAFRGADGWRVVARDHWQGALVVDGAGRTIPAPPELAWWGEFGADADTDRVALGTFWGQLGRSAFVAATDGTRRPADAPPIDGFVQAIAFQRLEGVDGALRTKPLWEPADGNIGTLAQRVGDRVVVTATSPEDEDLQLVGDHPDRLRATVYDSTSYDFRIGEILPFPGGYHWVTGTGEYVTLDEDLRRTDPLSLAEHLRTRGSVGDFVYEPWWPWMLGWALFGLPVVLVVGVGAKRIRPSSDPVPYLVGAWLGTALFALGRVLPMM